MPFINRILEEHLGSDAPALVQLAVSVDLHAPNTSTDPLNNAGGEAVFLKRVMDGWALYTCMFACFVFALFLILRVLKMFPTA